MAPVVSQDSLGRATVAEITPAIELLGNLTDQQGRLSAIAHSTVSTVETDAEKRACVSLLEIS